MFSPGEVWEWGRDEAAVGGCRRMKGLLRRRVQRPGCAGQAGELSNVLQPKEATGKMKQRRIKYQRAS